MLGSYAVSPQDIHTIGVRIGVSFISVKQVRRNLETERADGTTLEQAARVIRDTRHVGGETRPGVEDTKRVSGATRDILRCAVLHLAGFWFCRRFGASLTYSSTIQYPYEQDKDSQSYSGNDDKVHEGVSYWLLDLGNYSLLAACILTSHTRDKFHAVWGW